MTYKPRGGKYKLSETTRKRMSKARKGRKLSPTTRAKISAARKEREELIKLGVLEPYRHSEATKKLLRKLAKGRKPSKRALRAAVSEKRNRAADKKLAKKSNRGDFG